MHFGFCRFQLQNNVFIFFQCFESTEQFDDAQFKDHENNVRFRACDRCRLVDNYRVKALLLLSALSSACRLMKMLHVIF